MITQEDKDFVNFLFDKFTRNVDMDMFDLHDDDSCDDHIQMSQLELF